MVNFIKLHKTAIFTACLTMALAAAGFCEDPVWDPTLALTEGKNALVTLLTTVAPIVIGAMAIIMGWKVGIKLFRRLGKSI